MDNTIQFTNNISEYVYYLVLFLTVKRKFYYSSIRSTQPKYKTKLMITQYSNIVMDHLAMPQY